MKEYWANVYPDYSIGQFYSEKKFVEVVAEILNIKPLYRIHVRLK